MIVWLAIFLVNMPNGSIMIDHEPKTFRKQEQCIEYLKHVVPDGLNDYVVYSGCLTVMQGRDA